MIQNHKVDYLLVGHVSRDLTAAGAVMGGTVTYASRTAQVLGCRIAILTSAGPELDFESALPGSLVHSIPAGDSTTFRNLYYQHGRVQNILALAETIEPHHLPQDWSRAPIVHLGPIAKEVDPAIINVFSNSVIGITPQGWLRTWDSEGRVSNVDWPDARYFCPLVSAVVVSSEDIAQTDMLDVFCRWSKLLVITEQERGCQVILEGEKRHFASPRVHEVNPTGAGDIFAAAFFIRLYQTRGNPWEAARFANRIAAASVTKDTLDEKVQAVEDEFSKIRDGS